MKSRLHSGLSAADMKQMTENLLKTLKQQTDRTQNLQSKNTINYNPQVLVANNPSIIAPSILFFTSFKSAPALTFGQVASAYSGASGFFIVQPYVASWVSNSGGISGFNLGIYALVPVPPNMTNHCIMYNVRGKASASKDLSITPSWQQGYNSNVASHLTAGPGSMETS